MGVPPTLLCHTQLLVGVGGEGDANASLTFLFIEVSPDPGVWFSISLGSGTVRAEFKRPDFGLG